MGLFQKKEAPYIRPVEPKHEYQSASLGLH